MSEVTDAELEALADAATPGPWHIHEGDFVNFEHKDVMADWEEAYGPNEDEVGPDTAYILAVHPARVKRLLVEKRVAIKERDEALGEVAARAMKAALYDDVTETLRQSLDQRAKLIEENRVLRERAQAKDTIIDELSNWLNAANERYETVRVAADALRDKEQR